MALEDVRRHLSQHALDDRIMVLDTSTATVDEAAAAHGVDPDRIAKTLSFRVGEQPVLIVVSGQAKIDNRKYKDRFGKKAKMLGAEEVLEHTGHEVGGVCPFGLRTPLDVYLDVSLKKHPEVIPAAGDRQSSIRLTIEELERCSDFRDWVDVCR